MPEKHIVSHTDLDGIARAAAVLASSVRWGGAATHIVFSRRIPGTTPSTLAAALRTWLSDEIPPGSKVLFIDIPVDALKPGEYISALREFSSNREVIWSDHHETDLQYLDELGGFATVLWRGPSAFYYTYALVRHLGGDPRLVWDYAVLSAIGDRDPTIVGILDKKGLEKWLSIANGLDVMIRDISSKHDPADYSALAARLADEPQAVFEEAERAAGSIPVPGSHESVSPLVVLATEEVPANWGPKSLEALAVKTGAVYAIGVSPNPRDKTYAVRAITFWIAMAKRRRPEIGRRPEFKKWLSKTGKRAFGPPAAPVVPGFSSFEEALREARALAESVHAHEEQHAESTVEEY